jgi:hypothetical protein
LLGRCPEAYRDKARIAALLRHHRGADRQHHQHQQRLEQQRKRDAGKPGSAGILPTIRVNGRNPQEI